MTRFIHDQFAKDHLEELLKPFGKVEPSRRVSSEVRQIDVLFYPSSTQSTNIEVLGLLGKFANSPAMFEPFRNPIDEQEGCDCLLKQLEARGELQREAKRNKTTLEPSKIPNLWILTPTASQTILSGFKSSPKANWSTGIYFLADSLHTAIVVIHQLPCTPQTLWLRILVLPDILWTISSKVPG